MYDYKPTAGTVYIVGAGPGAPDLIAIRGRDIIAQADLILYADSLVEESVATLARKPDAKIVASSSLNLGEIMDLMVETAQAGGVVARVHSGDPALYGATHEQMAILEDHDVPYEIVPGITAAFAAAALLKTELTVPDVVQTIILTRTAGRTTMPEGEDLRTLAASGSSLAIYLSVTRVQRVIDDLLASGAYQPETPVAVLHKVTWPDESYVTGTLADIVPKVRAAKYTRHALILVSPALDPKLKGEDRRTSSHLYDSTYTHRFRKAENFTRGKERKEAEGKVDGVVAGEKHLASAIERAGTAIIGITARGSGLAIELAQDLPDDLSAMAYMPDKFTIDAEDGEPLPYEEYAGSALDEVRRHWATHQNLILVMATGIAIRAIAPLLGHKASDPAVICVDEVGRSVIPLIGGHQARANDLAETIASYTGGYAAITTASDVQGKPALDLLGWELDWRIQEDSPLTHASAALVNDEVIGVFIDVVDSYRPTVDEELEDMLEDVDNLVLVESLDELDVDTYVAGLIITDRPLSGHHLHLAAKSIIYNPPSLVVGIGCQAGVPIGELSYAVEHVFYYENYDLSCIAAFATVDLKQNEPGLQRLAQAYRVPLEIVSQETLQSLDAADFSPSAAQEKFNLPGVAEPCASVVGGGDVIVKKQKFERCTVAVASVRQ
ncbi:MAG: precorrin-4 C(11)-methyltransferase [Chloroflexota bacterium]